MTASVVSCPGPGSAPSNSPMVRKPSFSSGSPGSGMRSSPSSCCAIMADARFPGRAQPVPQQLPGGRRTVVSEGSAHERRRSPPGAGSVDLRADSRGTRRPGLGGRARPRGHRCTASRPRVDACRDRAGDRAGAEGSAAGAVGTGRDRPGLHRGLPGRHRAASRRPDSLGEDQPPWSGGWMSPRRAGWPGARHRAASTASGRAGPGRRTPPAGSLPRRRWGGPRPAAPAGRHVPGHEAPDRRSRGGPLLHHLSSTSARRRRRTVALAGLSLALCAPAVVAGAPAQALQTGPAVQPGHNITVTPDLDFVGVYGYGFNSTITVEVVRRDPATGQDATIGRAIAPAQSLKTGVGLELNHGPTGSANVPGNCWDTQTPDIRPGDRIVVKAGGATDEITVDDIRWTSHPVLDPATGDITVDGLARSADGSAIPA